jgi:hypothetical protein
MVRTLACAAVFLLALTAPASAAGLTGRYVEARTCDVWTGPCFANAEMNLSGKHAVLGWMVDKGSFDGVKLDGLGIVAVVEASDTLGLLQTGPAKAVLIIDRAATNDQRAALVKLAKAQGGDLLKNVVAVTRDRVDLEVCECEHGGCAKLHAGTAHIQTRCLDEKHDKVCGNESAFYPPLAKDVKVRAALAVENRFSGKGLGETWNDEGRRSAYLGSFQLK